MRAELGDVDILNNADAVGHAHGGKKEMPIVHRVKGSK
jgi:hypothetical protein